MADEKQLDALSAKVDALAESMKPLANLGETIANSMAEAMKPIKDHVDQIAANQKAQEDAERDELAAKVVKANLLDEDAAKATPLNALRQLAKNAKPGKTAALNGAFGGSSDKDEWDGYNMNANIDGAKQEAS